MKKLVIWDFDGVIADTEKIWIGGWAEFLNTCHGFDESYDFWYEMLAGVSDKTKYQRLKDEVNLFLDPIEVEIFFDTTAHKRKDQIAQLELTKDLRSLLEKIPNQCIATGSDIKHISKKIDLLSLNSFFNTDNVFSAQMVEHGKPEPDLFLFAAHQMGVKPQECIVIDDSVAGVTAAVRANMDVIAFMQYHGASTPKIIKEVQNLGVYKIAHDMLQVKFFLDEL